MLAICRTRRTMCGTKVEIKRSVTSWSCCCKTWIWLCSIGNTSLYRHGNFRVDGVVMEQFGTPGQAQNQNRFVSIRPEWLFEECLWIRGWANKWVTECHAQGYYMSIRSGQQKLWEFEYLNLRISLREELKQKIPRKLYSSGRSGSLRCQFWDYSGLT